MYKNLILVALAFLLPIGTVVGLNWEQVKPYVAGVSSEANGTLYCFQARG